MSARRIGFTALALAVVGGALVLQRWLWGPRLYGSAELALGVHSYAPNEPAACAPGSRSGPVGRSAAEQTAAGLRFTVVTPANYDPTRSHPLIVVYAPRGVNRSLDERYVGLTRAATTAGFVVAYADSRPLDLKTIEELGRIPAEVATRWCVDQHRVFFTGHSDGGTVSTALVVLGKATLAPAAIAPSAAGFNKADFSSYFCPAPLSVMVMHSKGDELFPGFGREAAGWWAACNGCDAHAAPRADGCVAYPSCREGVTTLYCEGKGSHAEWPGRNTALLEFFASAPLKAR